MYQKNNWESILISFLGLYHSLGLCAPPNSRLSDRSCSHFGGFCINIKHKNVAEDCINPTWRANCRVGHLCCISNQGIKSSGIVREAILGENSGNLNENTGKVKKSTTRNRYDKRRKEDCKATGNEQCRISGGVCKKKCKAKEDVIIGGCGADNCQCCVKPCKEKKRCSKAGGTCLQHKSDCTGKIIAKACKGKKCYCCLSTTGQDSTCPTTIQSATLQMKNQLQKSRFLLDQLSATMGVSTHISKTIGTPLLKKLRELKDLVQRIEEESDKLKISPKGSKTSGPRGACPSKAILELAIKLSQKNRALQRFSENIQETRSKGKLIRVQRILDVIRTIQVHLQVIVTVYVNEVVYEIVYVTSPKTSDTTTSAISTSTPTETTSSSSTAEATSSTTTETTTFIVSTTMSTSSTPMETSTTTSIPFSTTMTTSSTPMATSTTTPFPFSTTMTISSTPMGTSPTSIPFSTTMSTSSTPMETSTTTPIPFSTTMLTSGSIDDEQPL